MASEKKAADGERTSWTSQHTLALDIGTSCTYIRILGGKSNLDYPREHTECWKGTNYCYFQCVWKINS